MDFDARPVSRCITFTALFWCASFTVSTPASTADDMLYDMRRLMSPTKAERAAEVGGAVHIYDSIDINDVDAAMDKHFDRIQNMMFIRIHHLPPTGAGPAEVEEDGCD